MWEIKNKYSNLPVIEFAQATVVATVYKAGLGHGAPS